MKGKLKKEHRITIEQRLDFLVDMLGNNNSTYLRAIDFYRLILKDDYIINIESIGKKYYLCSFVDRNGCNILNSIEKEYVDLYE